MNIRSEVRRGFTLIEALVAVGIISVLTAIVYVNFNDARVIAKNGAFKSEMKEMQLALEVYKAQHGHYPPLPSCASTDLGGVSQASTETAGGAGSGKCGDVPVIVGLASEFIQQLPNPDDSANSSCVIKYVAPAAEDARTWYKLSARNCHGGSSNLAKAGDEFAYCVKDCDPWCNDTFIGETLFQQSYAVYKGDGYCVNE